MKLFTYGTLNYRGLLASLVARSGIKVESPLSKGILQGFAIRGVGRSPAFPAIYPVKEEQVTGIIWHNIPEDALYTLDRYEGVPSMYTRKKVNVQDLKGVSHECYVYVWAGNTDSLTTQWKPDTKRLINGGEYDF